MLDLLGLLFCLFKNKVGYINFQYFLNVLLYLCTSNILFSIKLFS